MDQGSSKRHLRQTNNQNLLNYVENGDVENVKLVINGGNCDVNKRFRYNGKYTQPLFIAIESL